MIHLGTHLTKPGGTYCFVLNGHRISFNSTSNALAIVAVMHSELYIIGICLEVYIAGIQERRIVVTVVVTNVCSDKAIYGLDFAFSAFIAGRAAAEAFCTGTS